jgi:hypothetical protein
MITVSPWSAAFSCDLLNIPISNRVLPAHANSAREVVGYVLRPLQGLSCCVEALYCLQGPSRDTFCAAVLYPYFSSDSLIGVTLVPSARTRGLGSELRKSRAWCDVQICDESRNLCQRCRQTKCPCCTGPGAALFLCRHI